MGAVESGWSGLQTEEESRGKVPAVSSAHTLH